MTDVREINILTGVETARPYTPEELAAIAAYVPPPAPQEPTKAELLAELQTLASKIEAMP